MTPQNKVTAAAIGGAITTLILWALSTFAKIDMPAEAGAALATLITAVLAYVVPMSDDELVAEVAKRNTDLSK